MQKWIAALRSRKYKHTFGQLYKCKEVCGMGVAGKCLLGANNFHDAPPSKISQVLGIDLYDEVVELNDNRGLKFYQIARYLERKLNAYIREQSTGVR